MYLQFVDGRARGLLRQFKEKGRDPLQLETGDRIKDAIQKWLVRETLFQPDREIANRAAFEYRDLLRAQNRAKQPRQAARNRRPSEETRIIEDILRRNNNLTAKEAFKRIQTQRKSQRKQPISAEGFKDRFSRVRKRLKEEAEFKALCDTFDKEDDSR